VYYISSSQLNILTPPGPLASQVQVQVTRGGLTSNAFAVNAQTESPSFFVYNGGPYPAAQDSHYNLIGPTALYAGLTNPAQPGETIVLYANGFGATSVPVVPGSMTQSGTLSPLPTVMIGSKQASVSFAGLVSPGFYQFNVTVPSSLTHGNYLLTATQNGFVTQNNVLLAIQ
jgi:uncharacterized protein (TIGR03437 family)